MQAAVRLAELQQGDGRWCSEDGPAFDVNATLEAVRTLHSSGQM